MSTVMTEQEQLEARTKIFKILNKGLKVRCHKWPHKAYLYMCEQEKIIKDEDDIRYKISSLSPKSL